MQSRCGYETPLGRCQRRSLGRCARHRLAPHHVRSTVARTLYTTHDDALHRRWAQLRDRRARDLIKARRKRDA